MAGDKERKSKLRASFTTGAIALVFLITGYQVALLVGRASAMRIVADRDAPDTVWVRESPSLDDPTQRAEACLPSSVKRHTVREAAPQLHTAFAGHPGTDRHPAEHSKTARRVYEAHAPRHYETFRFDPNTVSTEDLQRLGFSEKQAAAIDSYRQKGGRFRRKADFAKSYVVADSVYERLEPWIDIPLLDINAADSAAFDSLPGIGGYFAAKMVQMRTELGGYSCCEQLLDIWNFGQERYDGLRDLITCGPGAQPLRLWSLPEDSLKHHPYIRSWRTAHAIVLYRDSTPASEHTVEGLLKAGAIDSLTAARLSHCLVE